MENYKKFFKGKKITVMGLGLLGRGLGYTKFLAECLSAQAGDADLIVTDLKNKKQLATSLKSLKKYKNIKFVLGEHRLEDFRDRDMILKAAGVPLDSIYIREARKNRIPIEMDVSLFVKLAPNVKIIGVTGTRGKSMTTTLIYEILSKNIKNKKVYVGGNLRGVATLPLLKKVKEGDILVCELDSWQLQGFGDSKVSPNISVFTSFMPDHMNYYKDSMKKYFDDKANIFRNQKKDNVLIIRPGMKKFIKKSDVRGNFIVVNPKNVEDWEFNVLGRHHRENLACAVEVAKQFNIPVSKIKKTVASFKDLEGRMQLLKTYKGIKIYNDNNATTPEATIAGLEALNIPNPQGLAKKKVVLICGGADKNLPLENLTKMINKNCKTVVFLSGSGTDKFLSSQNLRVENYQVKDLGEAVKIALSKSKKGDTILFSPAFASFGMFNNEYERNDLFMKIIKKLK
ncbi:MAG: UDP-N-acetylmuramoyl-L-alanine--D-glutamate ligase [Candidatus Pacebacteria bacterium]|nr:UDP-N-acetylmuramoyl-L-alanine--D-glutamate ligase [Candidatus Paceibacterota bacterium]